MKLYNVLLEKKQTLSVKYTTNLDMNLFVIRTVGEPVAIDNNQVISLLHKHSFNFDTVANILLADIK